MLKKSKLTDKNLEYYSTHGEELGTQHGEICGELLVSRKVIAAAKKVVEAGDYYVKLNSYNIASALGEALGDLENAISEVEM